MPRGRRCAISRKRRTRWSRLKSSPRSAASSPAWRASVNNPVGISLTVASSLLRQSRLFAEEVERGGLRKSSLTNFLNMTNEPRRS